MFSAPIMAMEADSSDQLLEFRVWSYSPIRDSQGYTTLQQKPIYKSEFESRFRNCISFPDYNGTNTVENLSSAKWLRINLDPKELQDQSFVTRVWRYIIPRSITNIPYTSCAFTPKTKDLLKTMNYAISAMNSDTEPTRHMPIELGESDIVAKFEKKFPRIKYIDFYSTVGLGGHSYLDPETARLFTQLQDENRFSFYFTGELSQ
ncbi:hypothetical protein [Candidatus Paracaedibacter symbiosus]|uniref:hypothetical protein n=1 Tax=Candidatus Paracaedibacter symbiosus TaxID=244582 RepID=UPI0018DD1163|nr:hypothetical protein [Candidatus Paracaedibacter symbiosus]